MAVVYTDGSDGFEGDHIATIFRFFTCTQRI